MCRLILKKVLSLFFFGGGTLFCRYIYKEPVVMLDAWPEIV